MKPAKEHKSKRKKEKKSKKRKRLQERLLDDLKLVSLAQLGDAKKVQELLDSQGDKAVHIYDSAGFTPLHQACREGHYNVVELLLRHGADVRAEDFDGNTPAHVAAQHGRLSLLPLLLQATPAPNMDACNAAGISIQELIEAAMQAQEVRDHQAKRQKVAAEERDEWERLMDEDGPPNEMDEQQQRYDSEEEWEQRLREEAGMPLEKAYEEWGWSWSWGEGMGGADEEMDEDTYAQRIWESMERKKRDAGGASVAARETWGRADEASARRQASAREAEERSRRILEEERAKEAAWREAVLKGNVGARLARYEASWHTFVTAIKAGKKGLKCTDIPWPAEKPDDARAIILHGTTTPAEVRKRIRQELLRWHEDKFAKFQDRLAAADSQRIMERVKAITQMLNDLSSKQ